MSQRRHNYRQPPPPRSAASIVTGFSDLRNMRSWLSATPSRLLPAGRYERLMTLEALGGVVAPAGWRQLTTLVGRPRVNTVMFGSPACYRPTSTWILVIRWSQPLALRRYSIGGLCRVIFPLTSVWPPGQKVNSVFLIQGVAAAAINGAARRSAARRHAACRACGGPRRPPMVNEHGAAIDGGSRSETNCLSSSVPPNRASAGH